MIFRLLLAAALTAAALPAAAADAPPIEGAAMDTSETKAAREMAGILEEDPGAADVLALRILESSLGGALSKSSDPGVARREIREWIMKNPADAASLAIGFASDDASGRGDFEKSLYSRVKRQFALSDNRDAGMLGRLGKAAAISKTVNRGTKMDEEEQRMLIKSLFEGKSTIDGKVRAGGGGKGAGGADSSGRGGTAAVADAGMYDRLHSANPTGYSPEVLAFQSAMNQSRPPGAPALIETGKLDYPTLRHPFFGLKYDVDRLWSGYEAQRAWAIVRMLGLEKSYTRAQMADPGVRAELEGKRGGRVLDPLLERRRATLEGGRAALAAFAAEAEKTKKQSAITPARLRALSLLRRDAARWISVASLEEMIERLKAFSGFMTPPLRAMIGRVPVDAATRGRYAARGAALEKSLADFADKGERARTLLTTKDDPGSWAEAERLIAEVRTAARTVPARVAEFSDLPPLLLSAGTPASGWRAVLDRAALRFFPDLDYSQGLRKKAAERRKLLDAFLRIAR